MAHATKARWRPLLIANSATPQWLRLSVRPLTSNLSNGQNSAQELVGKHCSITVTDEQSPAICVIPLEIA